MSHSALNHLIHERSEHHHAECHFAMSRTLAGVDEGRADIVEAADSYAQADLWDNLQ